MIEIRELTKQYRGAGSLALDHVSLEIEGNGVYGLVGPNGAGKTTFIRILLGILHPTSGDACYAGKSTAEIDGKTALTASLGYLPQALGLYGELTGREFLKYVALLKRIPAGAARQQAIDAAIEMVGLGDKVSTRISSYSGGMKRRLGIAQAVLGEPKLLVLDEPTTGIDPDERVRIRNVFSDLARNCILILSTHIIEDVSQISQRMFVLHRGRLLFDGAPSSLIQQAEGAVWHVTTPGDKPKVGLIVSSLQYQDRTRYRLIGDELHYPDMEPVEPSLEDGYLWLVGKTGAAK